MKKYKLSAFLLAVLFVFSVFPFNTVYAVENTENTYEPDTYIISLIQHTKRVHGLFLERVKQFTLQTPTLF